MDIEKSSEVFGSLDTNPYDDRIIESITRHRRMLENTLFFDRLLAAVGLEDEITHYPPKSPSSLSHLFKAITRSDTLTYTHKSSLLYYIRKDLSLNPEQFASETYLPTRYTTLIDGLWLLDRGRCKEALPFLTEPTLIPTFSEEILYTIARQSPNNQELVLQYYNTTSPVLTQGRSVRAYFGALAGSNVTAAFFYTRKQADLLRRSLFELLISKVHGSSSGAARAERSVELVGLPFDAEEEEWFEDYLLKGDGKTLFGAKDSVIVRRIATGRGDEIQGLAKEVKERKIDGVNWHELGRGLAVD